MTQIAKVTPAREAALQARVPAIIYQTFKSADLPDRMAAAVRSWIDLNPSFEHRFHDNDDCARMIAEHFGPDVVAAYAKIESGAARADLWRYCQLYVTGGVYADVDTVCVSPLSTLIRPDDDFIVARSIETPTALFNGFFCTRPQHPFLKAAIDRATALVNDSATRFDVYDVTGPGNLGKVVNTLLGRPEDTAYEYGRSGDATLGLRILEKNPPTAARPTHVAEGDTVYVLTKYDGYLADLQTLGVAHWRRGSTPWPRQIKRVVRKIGRSVRKMLRARS